jgi:hypothetical protein
MSNFLHKCNGECKIYMLLLIAILGLLLFQCYNKNQEEFASPFNLRNFGAQFEANLAEQSFHPKMIKNGIISEYNDIPPRYEEAPLEDIQNLFSIFNLNYSYDNIALLKDRAVDFPFGYLYLDYKSIIIRMNHELLVQEKKEMLNNVPMIYKSFDPLLPADILKLLATNKVSNIKQLESKLSCQYIFINPPLNSNRPVTILSNSAYSK